MGIAAVLAVFMGCQVMIRVVYEVLFIARSNRQIGSISATPIFKVTAYGNRCWPTGGIIFAQDCFIFLYEKNFAR